MPFTKIHPVHPGHILTAFPYGPQHIAQPAGAIVLNPGDDIQAATTANAAGSLFWLRRGMYYRLSSIAPKTGNTYVGEYGATLDGTGWVSGDSTQAFFRAHNEDIDNVTIKNLVMRNGPQYGVRSYVDFSSGWTTEHCEIANVERGIEMCHNSVMRRCWVHHIRDAGYTGNTPDNVLMDTNLFEWVYGLGNQKLVEGDNHRWFGNWFRDCADSGIWEDGDNTNVQIVGNLIERMGVAGVFFEISGGTGQATVISSNIIRDCLQHGVLISTSRNLTVEHNDVTNCFRGIWSQVDLTKVGGGAIGGGWDLQEVILRNNTVRLSAAAAAAFQARWGSQAYMCGIDYSGAGDGTPYINGTKNIDYLANTHHVPDSGSWWSNAGSQSWAAWQALPQDATGTRIIG